MKRLLRRLLRWIFPELRGLTTLHQKNYVDVKRHRIFNAPYLVDESSVDNYTYIAINSHIFHTNIGKFCSIGPNFLCGWGIHPINGISTAPMFYSTQKQNGVSLVDENKFEERKCITIGNDVFIGANVTVLDGVTIGDGAVIGAGAVVSKDIPPYAVAVGCPIRIIKYRFEERQIEALKRIEWWNFEEEKLKEVEKMFFDLDKFIENFDNPSLANCLI